MREEQIVRALQILPWIAAGLTFLLYVVLRRGYHPERVVFKAFRELPGLVRQRQRGSSWYRRSRQWLLQNGAAFHYGRKIDPEIFLTVRILLALGSMATLWPVGWEWGVAVGILLFFLPCGMLVYLNGRDNEKLLPELKLVYHALEIQIRAGVYVTDALAECYGSVQQERLRSALLELAGDIVMKADIYEALDRFQGKFDNRYIDSLCITILQALESGQALELLGDIGEQIKDMEETVLERKKAALDRSITFYQLGVLAVVLGIALYACVTYMFGAAAGF